MNIIERTQYSADDGKTWKETRELAAADGVRSSLAVAVSRYDKSSCWNVASDVMRLCTHNPDALIAALRDMGALPEINEDWAVYLNSDIGAAFKRGSEQAIERAVTAEDGIEYNGQRYAVVPVEEYQRAAAALTEMDGAIVSGAITTADGVYAVIPAEQHEKQKAALLKIKDWARYGSLHSASKAARDWCKKHDIHVNEYK